MMHYYDCNPVWYIIVYIETQYDIVYIKTQYDALLFTFPVWCIIVHIETQYDALVRYFRRC